MIKILKNNPQSFATEHFFREGLFDFQQILKAFSVNCFFITSLNTFSMIFIAS